MVNRKDETYVSKQTAQQIPGVLHRMRSPKQVNIVSFKTVRCGRRIQRILLWELRNSKRISRFGH